MDPRTSRENENVFFLQEMMSLWTHQAGFPLLTVTKKGNSVTITQSPFKPAEFKAIYDENYDGNNFYNYTPPSTASWSAYSSHPEDLQANMDFI
uniref:Uncharacterized protein n=1 Tax=Megaselia scalaris TaxID=36166 RepID=T1GXR6_MEGSC